MQTFFKNPRYAFRLSEVGGAMAILGFPVSISVSQAGLFLAILGWCWFRWLVPPGSPAPEGTWSLDFQFPLELRVGLGIYGILLISLLANMVIAPEALNFGRLKRGWGAELKDVFLMGIAFWVLAYARDPLGRARLYRFLHIAAWIIVISGIVAVFSKFRLAKFPYHLMHGWVATPAARYQHFAGTLFGGSKGAIHLYMPIGFMGTHLTYAALLGFVFPFLLLRVAHPFVMRPATIVALASVRRSTLLVLSSLVLLLNNGRSAILGLVSTLSLAGYYFVRAYWHSRVRLLAGIGLAVALSIGAIAAVSPKMNDRFGQLVLAVFGSGKHTDWQRIFVWQGTLDIIARNPVIGVGPGGYAAEIEETIIRFSKEKPRLWYAYALIQRGHAHNDSFHLMAVGGPVALALYVWLMVLLIRRALLRADTEDGEYWKWAPLGLFAAGLYQCYFQDAEVLLPFWLFVGVLLNATAESQKSQAKTTSVRT